MVPPQIPDYTRAITHTHYKHGDKPIKKDGFSRMLPMRITENKFIVSKFKANPEKGFPHIDDIFLVDKVYSKVLPIWVGGTFLLLFLCSIFVILLPDEREIELFIIILSIVFFLGFLFF